MGLLEVAVVVNGVFLGLTLVAVVVMMERILVLEHLVERLTSSRR